MKPLPKEIYFSAPSEDFAERRRKMEIQEMAKERSQLFTAWRSCVDTPREYW